MNSNNFGAVHLLKVDLSVYRALPWLRLLAGSSDMVTSQVQGLWHDCGKLYELMLRKLATVFVFRAMRDLVDGHTHEAWARAAADLLQPAAKPAGFWSGADWQSAIRCLSSSALRFHWASKLFEGFESSKPLQSGQHDSEPLLL